MNIAKKIISVAAVIMTVWAGASAQTNNTPYSMYGYGIINDNATSAQRAMGGVGYAMADGRQINVMNPASYAAVDSLTFLFDMGLTVTSLHSRDNDVKSNDFGGGLDYITMLFPVHKRVGVSVGLVPYSSVGYSFGSKIENGASSRAGSGGLNQLYVGVGVKPFKGFTLGANIGYLFGTTINDIYAYPLSSSSTALFEKVTQVRDYHLDFGIQYSYMFRNEHRFTVGVTMSPKKDLLGHAWRVNYYNIGSNDVKADTVAYTSMKGKFNLPMSLGFGLNYKWRDRLMVEADLSYQNWKDAKFSELDDQDGVLQMDNRTKFSLGAQYVPKTRGNYFQRIAYRAGAFATEDYIRVGSNRVRERGLSIGFGLPAAAASMRVKTMINVGFEWRNRQATPNPLIKENYFNITLGINFNEVWFLQSKIY